MSKSILLAGGVFLASMAWMMLGTPDSTYTSVRAEDHEPPVLPVDNLPTEIDLELIPNGLDERPHIPADNPLTEEKVRLGRRLFFDPILSENNTVACASCHQPDHGFASPDEKAVGIRGAVGKRNAPFDHQPGLRRAIPVGWQCQFAGRTGADTDRQSG